jgi:hypothetical protein
LFWYLQRDFLSLIREFSGGKLKQKGFFHSAYMVKIFVHFLLCSIRKPLLIHIEDNFVFFFISAACHAETRTRDLFWQACGRRANNLVASNLELPRDIQYVFNSDPKKLIKMANWVFLSHYRSLLNC